jgi:hypothetical protein
MNFSKFILFYGLYSLPILSRTDAQNVGIGTFNPQATLHLGGVSPSLRIDNNGSLFLYPGFGNSYTQLGGQEQYSILQNNFVNGMILLRPASEGQRDVVIGSAGMALGPRGALGSLVPDVPLKIVAGGEAFRITGSTPYLNMVDGSTIRGYLQAWTDGIALASNGFDVGLWTNGAKRLAIKPSGAFEVAGNTGTAGQVLTSTGAASAPVWASPANAIYNSFRFVTMTQPTFESQSDNTWRDIPGLSLSLNFSGNHYVDVSAVFSGTSANCLGCDQPTVWFRLLVDGNAFTGTLGTMSPLLKATFPVTTGFTLPAGNHVIKWQVLSSQGSMVTLFSTIPFFSYTNYMRVWTAPQ